jgi:thymidylate synthase (FAD)
MNSGADKILDKYFPVLDHGFVALRDYMGGDYAITRAARTSYQGGIKKRTDDANLIRYLVRHDHATPLEFVQFTFHCQMPVFVARQWIRHRISSVNEMSGRYSIMPMMFHTPEDSSIQAQSKSNKQGRGGELNSETIRIYKHNSNTTRKLAEAGYKDAINNGVAKELARLDLPLSTYTNWFWCINLRSLFNFLTLRCDEHAQWEIRQYANVMAGMLKEVCPLAYEAWRDYKFNSVTFSAQEMQMMERHWRTGRGIDEEKAKKFDIGKFEFSEYKAKTSPNNTEGWSRDFELDMSKAKTAEYFEERAKAFRGE